MNQYIVKDTLRKRYAIIAAQDEAAALSIGASIHGQTSHIKLLRGDASAIKNTCEREQCLFPGVTLWS